MGEKGEGGFATIQHVVAAGLALVFFVLLANLVVMQYGRGVVRSALDEGARAGALSGAGPAECLARVDGVLDDLLGGPLFADLIWTCSRDGEWMVAAATGRLAGWLPMVPDIPLQMEGRASIEI
ncbi:MAG: hypothetical protein OEY62_07570 [Acidimicrobiia bacterium]|nr:hypothetical protein [Acidimicrobiia bacterium]